MVSFEDFYNGVHNNCDKVKIYISMTNRRLSERTGPLQRPERYNIVCCSYTDLFVLVFSLNNLTFSFILCIEKVLRSYNFRRWVFSGNIRFMVPCLPNKGVKTISICIKLLSLCGSKAGAKATIPILLKFHKNTYFRQE